MRRLELHDGEGGWSYLAGLSHGEVGNQDHPRQQKLCYRNIGMKRQPDEVAVVINGEVAR